MCRRIRIHRCGDGRREGDNRRGFPIGVRNRPINKQLQGDSAEPAVHFRRENRSANPDRRHRVGGGAAEPQEERHAHRPVA